jgi:hypothetical protein
MYLMTVNCLLYVLSSASGRSPSEMNAAIPEPYSWSLLYSSHPLVLAV